jgi:5-methylcytosine-specific restriction endonuclease McrA
VALDKKQTRQRFRDLTFKRDGHKCRVCGLGGTLDAHHIIDRHDLPNGGYVPENGISLCPDCHLKAEAWHSTGTAILGYHPEDLFTLIGSDLDKAIEASERLGD